jgi:hypothetical protein
MKLYHRTTAEIASRILAHGFKDATGYYLTFSKHTGVWLSDWPLDMNEGAKGDTLLEVILDEEPISDYEWIEEGKTYREWLVPASLINPVMQVGIIQEEELEAIEGRRWTNEIKGGS